MSNDAPILDAASARSHEWSGSASETSSGPSTAPTEAVTQGPGPAPATPGAAPAPAPATLTPTATRVQQTQASPVPPYGNLSYAPRQSSFRNSPAAQPSTIPLPGASPTQSRFEATQSGGFISHSSFLATANQAVSSPASKPDGRLRDLNASLAPTPPEVLEACERRGIGKGSPGYVLVSKLLNPIDAEWRELAQIVGSGQATLLLPVAYKSSSSSSSSSRQNDDLSLSVTTSFAQDHILFPSNARATTSDIGNVTLSGLRTVVEHDGKDVDGRESTQATLHVKSFVARGDRVWASELRNADSRRTLLAAQSPLPQASCADYPYPNYPLLSQTQIVFPDSPTSALSSTPRSGTPTAPSGSSTLMPALASSGHRSSPSASFVSLFGGAGRDRRKAPPSEMLDVGQATPPSTAPSSPITIPVWLIDRPLRRSRALRGMIHSVQARLIKQLQREAAVPPEIGEVVASFASAFYPPVDTVQVTSHDSSHSQRSRSSSAKSATSLASAPPIYTAQPEEVAVRFQDLYHSVEEQLLASGSFDGSSLAEAMEVVEKFLTQELHDRIFSPVNSADRAADRNLSTRIAALNLLGLDWPGLGLDLPADDASVRQGLDEILAQCSAVLQDLQSGACHAPGAKISALVKVHRIIVEGLDGLPRIALKSVGDDRGEDDSSKTPQDSASTSSATEVPPSSSSSNTSSADLILPLLIRLIVSSNPTALASHLLYIQRYRNETSLSSGEGAYCLINFQAAVQFIEHAKPAELGLDDHALAVMLQDDATTPTSNSAGKSAAIEMLKHVESEQAGGASGAAASGSTDLPVGGRMRGLTGVVNSSFSVLGRVIGSGASAGMEAWDRGSKNIDGVRTLEDIRSLLGGSMAKSATTTKELVNMLREKEAEGNEGEPQTSQPASKAFSDAVRKRASSIRSIGSARSVLGAGTDYSSVDEREKDIGAAFDLSVPTPPPPMSSSLGSSSSRDPSKPSIGDRLANLNWRVSTTSPSLPAKDLPSVDDGGRSNESNPPPHSPSLLLPPMTPRTPTYTAPLASPGLSSHRELPGPPPPVKRSGGGDRPTPLRSPQASYFPPTSTATTLPASLQSPFAPLSSPPAAERPLHVVLASSGSVASIKIPLIVEKLLEHANVRVQIIATKSSLHFYDRKAIIGPEGHATPYTVGSLAQENLHASRERTPQDQRILPRAHLWTDEDEWSTWTKVGDPILHIELRRWADIVLVAPCSANTLAKISGGICDNLLTSFLRALSPATPTVLYPAMNTLMYMHPLTAKQIDIVTRELGYSVQGPIEKKLACGDMGAGAMVEWSDIVEGVVRRFGLVKRDETVTSGAAA